ncbi:hypothetical protein DFP72DRAFT_446980 [Ephemerocybe angulata]|uniref:Uncharacterized protein n=1 Tax=Ephemerocybe angulata TaxID=980116 RepID=A0A8H6HTL7_9AGAR|nr:hypothetical protein DFP72DRAFT_446980 [Tulosesus angulatus]
MLAWPAIGNPQEAEYVLDAPPLTVSRIWPNVAQSWDAKEWIVVSSLNLPDCRSRAIPSRKRELDLSLGRPFRAACGASRLSVLVTSFQVIQLHLDKWGSQCGMRRIPDLMRRPHLQMFAAFPTHRYSRFHKRHLHLDDGSVGGRGATVTVIQMVKRGLLRSDLHTEAQFTSPSRLCFKWIAIRSSGGRAHNQTSLHFIPADTGDSHDRDLHLDSGGRR